MKTLDEVIAELEDEGLFADALHYLKEYKEKQDEDWRQSYIAVRNEILFGGEDVNPPLTWSELKQMEGKPVWVDGSAFAEGFWTIITGFGKASDTEYVFLLGDQYWKEDMKEADDGVSWQAYRKERQ